MLEYMEPATPRPAPPGRDDLDELAGAIWPLGVDEYEHLAARGAFGEQRVELLRGVVVAMSPQGWGHAEVVALLTEVLVLALRGRYRVRPQLPLRADDTSMPEPDLAVVEPGLRRSHPRQALLVIEVAASSLRRDTRLKALIYAEAGVPEYWVADINTGELVRHTGPGRGGYRQVERLGRAAVLRPPALPELELPVAELIPDAVIGALDEQD
jgi:Uma2 family endonuclease